MANSRGPQYKTKTREQATAENRLKDLFNKPAAELVPVHPQKSADTDVKSTPTGKSGKLSGTKTEKMPNRAVLESRSTRPSNEPLPTPFMTTKTITNRPFSVAKPGWRQMPEDHTKIFLGAALVIGMAVMTAFFLGLPQHLASTDSTSIEKQAQIERDALAERVEFHRKSTGWKLNRERVKTELENDLSAPPLPVAVKHEAAPDIMRGLPLQGEPAATVQPWKETTSLNPNYPDAKVMYMLQDEQDAVQWEERAREAYVEDLKKNAAAKGYDAQVDTEGNVRFQKLQNFHPRQPAEVDGD